MPSMFSKRSRSLSTTRMATPASSSAHLAAAQAFLASQPSQSNLSASAAATALRTMSPPPTAVDQVQTKRMLSRQTSNSSIASAPRGRTRGTVQRRTSQGSMTERTFRSPSPGQPASPPSPAVGVGRGAPPVPALPRTYSDDVPPIPSKFNRRSASMDALSQSRVGSSPLTRPAGRGQNMNQNPVASSAATLAAKRSTNTQTTPNRQRSDSQDSPNSVNFSYPRGTRPNSPPPRSPLASTDQRPSSQVTNGISTAETARIQHELNQTAARPVKKKKPRADPSLTEGSHLQTGTMGFKPVVTPLEPLSPDYKPPEAAETTKKPKKKAVISGQSSHFPERPQSPAAEERSSDNEDAPKDKRALRGAGVLMKHPSVVREDWEGEQEHEESSPTQDAAAKAAQLTSAAAPPTTPTQIKKPLPEANMSRKIEDPAVTSKPALGVHGAVTRGSVPVQSSSQHLLPSGAQEPAARKASVSPSRSTRFSDRLASDLVSGRKHEPLGRSVSPAKSALKHSAVTSDASPTDPRFPGRRTSSVTPSEASDISVDGTGVKKKSVRVSFEDAKDAAPETRSAKETTKKGWFSQGKGKTGEAVEDLGEGMKPRPALPSFGSVRRSDRSVSPNVQMGRTTEQHPVNTKSPSSSEASSIADPPTMDTSISSDHAIGGVILKDSQKAHASTLSPKSNSPLPPTVTSVEGTGYESDTDSVYSDGDKPLHAAQSASQELGRAIGGDDYSQVYKDEIPMISVLPATPGIDEMNREEWGDDVPGGFPASATSSNVSIRDEDGKDTGTFTSAKDTAGLGLSESNQDYSSPAAREASPQQLMTIAEEDSDNNSVYSDAAEDLSDLEGDGFGSINAIVESPMVPASKQRVISPPESPIVSTTQRRPVEIERTASWDDTQAHWSGVAQRSRETKTQPVPSGKTTVPPSRNEISSESTPRKQVSNVAPAAPVAQSAAATAVPKSQKPKSAYSRVTSDSSASPVVATRTSVPAKPQGHFRSSMRGEPEAILASVKQRPASYATPSPPPHAALQKKSLPTVSNVVPTPAPRPIVRRFSNDSDSDSSFKKARRNKKPADGAYAMRRSMRSGPSEQNKTSAPVNRNGIRSLSPPTDRRPTSPMGTKTMRGTMRGSSELGTPTLRGKPEEKRSSSLFSRNRTAKSPPRPAPSSTNKMKSRFTDSDDEDESRATHYTSRFENSSDEDEPKTFRPVRGIPPRKDGGDSTDLDDSSDDQARKNKDAAAKKLTINPPPQSQDILSPPASPTTAKRRGLWSRLRGKKKDGEIASSASQIVLPQQGTKVESDAVKDDVQEAKQLGFNSAAEREALIEQTRLKLEAARDEPQPPLGRPASLLSGRQRRATPQRVFSDSWAPPKIPAATDDRPQTSGGIEVGNRPAVGSRQPTLEGVNGEGVVLGKNGKKKKFGFLRKAFGLVD